jgi:hypothetical protein
MLIDPHNDHLGLVRPVRIGPIDSLVNQLLCLSSGNHDEKTALPNYFSETASRLIPSGPFVVSCSLSASVQKIYDRQSH